MGGVMDPGHLFINCCLKVDLLMALIGNTK